MQSLLQDITYDDLTTEEQAFYDVLLDLATERPDWVDPGVKEGRCRYTNSDGKPSCIIGHAIVRTGIIPPPEFGTWDNFELAKHLLPFSDVFNDRLSMLQDAQDHGKVWGEAILNLTGFIPKNDTN